MYTLICLILFLVFIFIIFILLVSGIIQGPPTTETMVDRWLDDINKQAGWSTENLVSGERGICQMYQTFNIQTSVVDDIQPISTYEDYPEEFRCSDGYLQALLKVQHTCEQPLCLGYDGNEYTQGQIEQFYTGCGDFPPCSNGRSAIILNYHGELTPEARCLTMISQTSEAEIRQFTAGGFSQGNIQDLSLVLAPCEDQIDITSQQFFSVDSIPVYTGAQFAQVRIRVPNHDQCLVYNDDWSLAWEPCIQRKDKGFTWFFTRQITEVIPEQPTTIYPSQITEMPTGITFDDLGDVNDVIQILKQQKSIQASGDNITLQNFASCKSQPCISSTGIVSAYTWNEI